MERKTAASCRWAVPTLFLREPLWLDAQDYPWTCLRDDRPRPLATTEDCATCPYWEQLRAAPIGQPLPHPAVEPARSHSTDVAARSTGTPS